MPKKRMPKKRITQLDAVVINSIEHGGSITRIISESVVESVTVKLLNRGLLVMRDGKVYVSDEGRDAFNRWEG